MARFRLRYNRSDLDLALGDFIIGRSSRSNLAFADGLVSRKHAALHVGLESVTLEDFGSRNGVVVNGVRIEGTRELVHMDRLFIGSQELLFIDAEQITDRMGGERYVVCDSCGAVSGAAKRHCGDCGQRLDPSTGETSKDLSSVNPADPAWTEDTRPLRRLEVIGGIADKAMKLGRIDEAERALLPHLDELLERAMKRRPLADSADEDSDVLFDKATGFALSLARGPRGSTWIDWVFRFHTATERIMTSDTVDTLHELVRKSEYRRPRYLQAYLHVLGKQVTRCSSAERFMIGRIGGLAKVVEARGSAMGM